MNSSIWFKGLIFQAFQSNVSRLLCAQRLFSSGYLICLLNVQHSLIPVNPLIVGVFPPSSGFRDWMLLMKCCCSMIERGRHSRWQILPYSFLLSSYPNNYGDVIYFCRRLPARDGGYPIVRTISGCGRPAHWSHHHGEVTVRRSPVPRPRGRWRMSNIFVGDAKYFLGRGRGRRRGREWDWSDVCGANQKRHGQRWKGGCSRVSSQQSSGI